MIVSNLHSSPPITSQGNRVRPYQSDFLRGRNPLSPSFPYHFRLSEYNYHLVVSPSTPHIPGVKTANGMTWS